MKRSLVDKAHSLKPEKQTPDKERASLSLAWAFDEVSFTQAQKALGATPGSGVYAVLARGLRDALRLGLLERSKGKAAA